MAAELRKEFPKASIDLLPSGGGRFEVMCDDEPVYQKSKTHRHAAPGEIVGMLRQRSKNP